MNERIAKTKRQHSGRFGRTRRKHRDALRMAGWRLRERPFAHAFALSLLALSLMFLLLLKLGVDQLQVLGSPLSGARTLSLFLDPADDEASARTLAGELSADPRVATVDAISPAEGLRELAHVDGSSEALAALPDNPLPWVLAVEPVDRESGVALADTWRERPEIEYLTDESDWQDRADTVLRAARMLVAVLAALIVAAVLMLAANAVRTIRVEGADERALQRVFGATESDLRRPYVYVGALYGLIAGVVAVGLSLAIMLILRPAFAALADTFNAPAQSATDGLPLLLCIPAAVLLGAVGAWLGCLAERDLEPVE
jgi:cell division transport system permease protein